MDTSKIKSNNKVIAYLSFLVWPVFALVFAIFNYRSSWAKNIVWLFCIFFGFNLIVANELVDANRYQDMLIEWHEHMHISFWQLLVQIYEGNIGKGDFIQPILTYIVSTFSSDGRILFAFFGGVFGFFYSRNIWLILDQAKGKLTLSSLLYLLLFIFTVPIWDINGFRFWLATHMFLYGCLHVFLLRKKRFVLVAATSILAHVAFLPAVVILVGHQIIGNRTMIYIGFFVMTSLVMNLDLGTLVGFIPKISSGVDVKLAAYTHEEYVENIKKGIESSAWFIKWKLDALRYTFIFLTLWTFFFKSKMLKAYKLESFFHFLVLFTAIANVLSIIPSGSRYLIISYLCWAGFFFIFLQHMTSRYWINRLNIFLSIPILFFIVIQIRLGLDYMGYNSLLSNPMLAAYFENKTSLFSLISN